MNKKMGYKETKLGWIPEDWKFIPMLEFIDSHNSGANIKSSEFEDLKLDDNYTPILPKSGISYGGKVKKSKNALQYLNKEKSKLYSNSIIKKGELAIVLRDLVPSGPNIGLMCVLDESKPRIMAQGVYSLSVNKKLVLPEYLCYISNVSWYRKIMKKTLVGSTQVHLGLKDFFKIQIFLPPLPEQQKIANILNTWDKAIATQEKLIAEKQKLKKGLMQQLLTGKKRFAGFTEEWDTKSLTEIGEIYTGGTPSTSIDKYWNGNITWYTPTEITKAGKYINDSKRKITEIGLTESSAQLFPKNTIVVCTRATIGQLSISEKSATTNQGFKNICPNQDYNLNFIYYKLLVEKKRFISKSCGSTFLELSTTDFRNFKILVPSLREQEKIAEILSNIDKEIENLEFKLKKLKLQKQGLMQQLLTGEKRVKL